jgi:hypothetical protein
MNKIVNQLKNSNICIVFFEIVIVVYSPDSFGFERIARNSIINFNNRIVDGLLSIVYRC